MQAFIGTGFNLVLSFNPLPGFDPRFRQMDFEKEPGRVRKTERKTDDISPIIISRAPASLFTPPRSLLPYPIYHTLFVLFFHISSLSAPFSGSPFSPPFCWKQMGLRKLSRLGRLRHLDRACDWPDRFVAEGMIHFVFGYLLTDGSLTRLTPQL